MTAVANVVLVATDTHLRTVVGEVLRSLGIAFECAADAAALRARSAGEPDLVLVAEPAAGAPMSTLLAAARDEFRRPIVLLAHAGDPRLDAAELLALGVIDVIPGADPALPGDLARWTRQLLRAMRALVEPLRQMLAIPPSPRIAARTANRAPTPTAEAAARAHRRTQPVAAAGTGVIGSRREAAAESTREVPIGLETPQCIAIGISTGGPAALAELWPQFDPTLLPPVLVVQHMPADFVPPFAARLTQGSRLPTSVADDMTTPLPGHAYIAPGNRHLTVQRQANGGLTLRVVDEPTVSGHRPSADRLFRSLADARIPTLGIQMTGMGRDGAAELKRLCDQGCLTIGQDEASCVVYGMPRVAMELGAIRQQMPLREIPGYVQHVFRVLATRRGTPL